VWLVYFDSYCTCSNSTVCTNCRSFKGFQQESKFDMPRSTSRQQHRSASCSQRQHQATPLKVFPSPNNLFALFPPANMSTFGPSQSLLITLYQPLFASLDDELASLLSAVTDLSLMVLATRFFGQETVARSN